MKNREFDEWARRAAREEVFTMSDRTESRIKNALSKPIIASGARRVTVRTIVIAALIVALLCGVALAAVNWGTRDMVHVPDKDKGSVPNANIDPYVTPVGKIFESDALRVEVIDALYDGRALAIAWTVENKLNTTVYLVCHERGVDGNSMGQGSMRGVDELFIKPGEIVKCGFVQDIVDNVMADDCTFRIGYDALEPTGEVVSIKGMSEDDNDKDYMANIDALVAEGKVVVAPDGVIELGSAHRWNENETEAQQLVRAGVMKEAGALDVEIALPRTGKVLSWLKDGQPVEASFDGYTLRVTKCEITPLVVRVEMDCVFESAEALMRFKPYYETKHGPLWSFTVLANGDDNWNNNMGSGFIGEEPQAQPDGSYVWHYEYQAMEPYFTPEEVTIMARRDVGDQYDVPFPEESVTLTIGE